MTRITFLIGNGFDINVGLNTKYRDFYEYYIKKHPDDMLAKNIGENHIYWSDLELGLGRYTEKVKPEDIDAFWESEAKLEQELANYLENQMERVNINDEDRETETAIEMQRSLTEFTNELPDAYHQHINNVLDGVRENIIYSFMSFNYTNVLDKCLSATQKVIPENLGRHYCNGGLIYSHDIGDILHIHGKTNSQMVLGVNDEEQVANKEFTKKTLYRQFLIKKETIYRFDPLKITKARNIIDESIIICVFGMSIGRTDKAWWSYLCDWLKDDEKRVLIIYKKIKNGGRMGKHVLFAEQDEVKHRLKNNAEISEEMWEQIENQIYINCATNIFNFKILDK